MPHNFVEIASAARTSVVDAAALEGDLRRQLRGDVRFDSVQELPLFWLPVEAVIDPKIIADWTYTGSLSGSWSHVDLIKAAS